MVAALAGVPVGDRQVPCRRPAPLGPRVRLDPLPAGWPPATGMAVVVARGVLVRWRRCSDRRRASLTPVFRPGPARVRVDEGVRCGGREHTGSGVREKVTPDQVDALGIRQEFLVLFLNKPVVGTEFGNRR